MRTIGKDTILDLADGLDGRIAPSARKPAKRSRTGSYRREVLTASWVVPGAVRRALCVAKHCGGIGWSLRLSSGSKAKYTNCTNTISTPVASRRGSSNAPIAGKAQSIQPRRPPLELMKFAKPERYAILHLV